MPTSSGQTDLGGRPAREADDLAWFAIHTRSRFEDKVESALTRKGLEVFLPRLETLSRRRDRRLLLKRPLFPGYLFVQVLLDLANYQKIIKVPGVVRLLGAKDRPTSVAVEIIDSLKTIVDSGRLYFPHPYLAQGMKVCIKEGALAGAVGIILRRREKKRRLVVDVELFQRSVAVELDDEAVEPWS